jgi:DNA-binding MarR family transcriptional regulator
MAACRLRSYLLMTPSSGSEDLLLERQLCFALAVASQWSSVRTGQSSRNLNLTHPQYLVMLALWETSPRSAREISESLMLGAATLSPLLKRLEASGYLMRGRAHGDERSLAVSLTPSGTALRAQALAIPGTMLDKLGLSREQAHELHRTLTALISAADDDIAH